MSIAFDIAFDLSQKRPLPKDIIKQLEALEADILPSEAQDFSWIYEGVILELSDTAS